MASRRLWFTNPITGGVFPESRIIDEAEESFSQKTSDDLSEGVENLYFTNDRVADFLTAGTSIGLVRKSNGQLEIEYTGGAGNTLSKEEVQDFAWDVLGGSQNLIDVTYRDISNEVDFTVQPDLSQYDNSVSQFVSDLSSFTTDNLSEGSSNLYFTEERVDDRVNSLIQGGSNVTTTYDDANDTLTIDSVTKEDVQDFAWDVLTGVQSLITVTYDDVNDEVHFSVESDLSQYDNSTSGFTTYDSTDFDTDFSNKSTDNLSEGSANLYYTDERVQDVVDSLLSPGANISLTYDDPGNTLSIAAPDEDIQDAIYENVLSGDQARITVNYDDANNEVDYTVDSDLSNYSFANVTTDVLNEGSTNLYYTDERVDDRVNDLLVEGSTNLTFTYNDSTNTLILDVATNDFTVGGDLIMDGPSSSFIHDRQDVSSDITTDGSAYYSVDTSSGDITITISSTDATDGREVNIKKIAGNNDVIVNTEGSETIDNGSDITIPDLGSAITLIFNSTTNDWEIY